jgi:hypothetical protein
MLQCLKHAKGSKHKQQRTVKATTIPTIEEFSDIIIDYVNIFPPSGDVPLVIHPKLRVPRLQASTHSIKSEYL